MSADLREMAEHIKTGPLNQDEWQRKLIGKTLVDGEIQAAQKDTHFSKTDLPDKYRVLAPPMYIGTMEYDANRLTIKVDEEEKVTAAYCS